MKCKNCTEEGRDPLILIAGYIRKSRVPKRLRVFYKARYVHHICIICGAEFLNICDEEECLRLIREFSPPFPLQKAFELQQMMNEKRKLEG